MLTANKIIMPDVRIITTSLTHFSKLKDTDVASKAQLFLEKGFNNGNDKFQSYGNKENYSDETSLKVK